MWMDMNNSGLTLISFWQCSPASKFSASSKFTNYKSYKVASYLSTWAMQRTDKVIQWILNYELFAGIRHASIMPE